MGQRILLNGVVNSLQSGAIIITHRDIYYKKVRFITKWDIQIMARANAKWSR